MRILFDTNVLLDLLLDRKPFSESAAELFTKIETGKISGYICATTVTTIHYLAVKAIGADQARREIRKLTSLFEIAPINRAVLEDALEANFEDFEDAVIYEAALHVDAKAIVTRNVRDYGGSAIPVYSPEDMLKVVDTN